jgi:uncharacterized protein (DUF58 family)
MAQLADFLTPDDLHQIRNLQVLARTVVEGFCTGLHRSPHKGFSVEFKQHRPYVHGDEIRHLDWRVFGKTDRFYIREYEEETNLRCTIILDASGSMAYGGAPGRNKFQYAQRLAACLSYLMLGQQDSVGLVTFDTKVRRYIPPRGQTSHLKVLVNQLEETKTGGETELAKVFHDLVPRLHRRGMVVILSDLFGDVQELLSALAHLRFARHEIVVFQIWDPDELTFDFRQWTRFDCLEVDGKKHLVDPNHLRAAYLDHLAKFREELKQGCHRHRIDLVPLSTNRPYAEALAEYLTVRMGR